MTSEKKADGWPLLFGAWVIALASSLAVLFVGEVMGQVPCNLCWFQRAFMFPLGIMLAVATLRSDTSATWYALPLATAGLLIAGFHTLLYVGFIPESIQPCTASGPSCSSADMTILGGVPLPALSFAAFGAVIILLFLATRRAPA